MAAEAETHAAEQLFEQLAVRFLADPTVDQRTGFGSNPGLRVEARSSPCSARASSS
jgi:hypothetical protein